MATVVNSFNAMTAAELLTALPKLAPQTSVATMAAAMGAASSGMNLVSTRMASARGDSTVLADGSSGVSAGDQAGRAFWVRGLNTDNKQGAYDGFSGYKSSTLGFAIGGDTSLADKDNRVGAAVTYASTAVDQQDASLGSKSKLKTVGLAFYGSRELGLSYVEGQVGYANHDNDGTRLTALSRTATSSATANQWSARVGGGHRIAMGGKTVFTPLASLDWSRFKQDAYTETGANALNLTVNSVSSTRVKGGVGFRLSGESAADSGMVFKPEMHAMYSRDFKDKAVDMTSNFTGGGASFVTTGQKIKSDSYNVGTSVTFLQGKTGQVAMAYDYEGRSGFSGHTVQLQGRWMF